MIFNINNAYYESLYKKKLEKYRHKINQFAGADEQTDYKYDISQIEKLRETVGNETHYECYFYILNCFVTFVDNINLIYDASLDEFRVSSGMNIINFGTIELEINKNENYSNNLYIVIHNDMKKDIIIKTGELDAEYGELVNQQTNSFMSGSAINIFERSDKKIIRITEKKYSSGSYFIDYSAILTMQSYSLNATGGRVGNNLFGLMWQIYYLVDQCKINNIKDKFIIQMDENSSDFVYFNGYANKMKFMMADRTSKLTTDNIDRMFTRESNRSLSHFYNFIAKSPDSSIVHNLDKYKKHEQYLFDLSLDKNTKNIIDSTKETGYFTNKIALHFRGTDFCITKENTSYEKSFVVLHFKYYYDSLVDIINKNPLLKINICLFYHPFDENNINLLILYLTNKLRKITQNQIVFMKERELTKSLNIEGKINEVDIINLMSKFEYIILSNSSMCFWAAYFNIGSKVYVCNENKIIIDGEYDDTVVKYNFYGCFLTLDKLHDIVVNKMQSPDALKMDYLFPCNTIQFRSNNPLSRKLYINYFEFFTLLEHLISNTRQYTKDDFTREFEIINSNITASGSLPFDQYEHSDSYVVNTDKINILYDLYTGDVQNIQTMIPNDKIPHDKLNLFVSVLMNIKNDPTGDLLVKLLDGINYMSYENFVDVVINL